MEKLSRHFVSSLNTRDDSRHRVTVLQCYSAATNITRFLFYSETNKTDRKMAQQVVTLHGLQEHRRQIATELKAGTPVPYFVKFPDKKFCSNADCTVRSV
jgi:hypothetical protein